MRLLLKKKSIIRREQTGTYLPSAHSLNGNRLTPSPVVLVGEKDTKKEEAQQPVLLPVVLLLTKKSGASTGKGAILVQPVRSCSSHQSPVVSLLLLSWSTVIGKLTFNNTEMRVV